MATKIYCDICGAEGIPQLVIPLIQECDVMSLHERYVQQAADMISTVDICPKCLDEVIEIITEAIRTQRKDSTSDQENKMIKLRQEDYEYRMLLAFADGMGAGYAIDHENIHEDEAKAIKEFAERNDFTVTKLGERK